MARLKGCLTLLFGLLLLGLAAGLLKATWPVCAPAVLVTIAWFMIGNSKHPVKNAIHEVLGPIVVGLLLVCGLLLLFSATNPSPDMVNHTERALVYVDNRAPAVTKLSTPRFSVVMVVLMAIAYSFPKIQSVTRFTSMKKWVGRATATVGAATTFTFFTNVAIVQPKVPYVYMKIQALYRKSKEGEIKAVDRYLAAKAVERGISKLNSSEQSYGEDLLDSIAAVSMMNRADKKVLADYTASQLHGGLTLQDDAENARVAVPDLPHRDAVSLLDVQMAKEKTAGRFADEAVKAAQESLSFGNDALKDLGWSFIDGLIGEQGREISGLVKPFINEILDKYLEKYTDPLLTKQGEAVRHFFQHPEIGEAAKVVAQSEMRSGMALMSLTEASQAQNAARQALQSAQNATTDMNAGDEDKAQLELSDAERASANSQKYAESAKSAANSLKNTEHALLTVPDQTRVVVAAAEAAEAARSLRAAADAEEAIRMARITAQAVEDARAAKNAAEIAEATKTILRAIPK